MSGTSMDGIDAALVEVTDQSCTLKATSTLGYPKALKQLLREIAGSSNDSLHNVATADREVGHHFALAVKSLITTADVSTDDVRAIGSHGQTVRHFPPASGKTAYTVQIGDPSTIAEETGIMTVADFRRQDIAAGGEGAPLAPAFHGAQFGSAGSVRAIVNIGGISNATVLRGNEVVAGFDCGPGNTLLDGWIKKIRGDDYDAFGAWSAESELNETLFEKLIEDSFFNRRGPKSTGVELFNQDWLSARLTGDEVPGDVQATLSELTAYAISTSLNDISPMPDAVYVCGGGARNDDLMRRLNGRLGAMNIRLGTTDEIGLASEWVEASAWAWLAYRHMSHLSGNIPAVTGAAGPRVLGARYPAYQQPLTR